MSFKPGSAAVTVAVTVLAGVWLSAQTPQVFQFVVSATDASGASVTDLRPEDVVMSEDGVRQQVVKVEPLAIPMKLTIAVDNGLESSEALGHYRAGLTGLIQALPPDVNRDCREALLEIINHHVSGPLKTVEFIAKVARAGGGS